jgi:GTP-binding protein EngB required for normal cell division
MRASGVPFRIVATKVDKLNKTERAEAETSLTELAQLATGRDPILFSSVTKEGVQALWNTLYEVL